MIDRKARIESLKTKGVKIDDEDLEKLYLHTWTIDKAGYVRSNKVDGSGKSWCIYMHHYVLGVMPNRAQPVDHINRNRLDNRKANLRIVTVRDNCLNRGVCVEPSVFLTRHGYQVLQQDVAGKVHVLGTYSTLQEASKHRDSLQL
jgi:hypothetical protein